MTSRGTYSFQQQISVLAIMAPKDVGVLRVLLALIVCCCSIIAGSAVNMPSAELAVCADCWSKEALGPVKEGEGGHPQVTCEAVLAQAYWAELKLTDQLLHPERLCLAVEFPAGEPMGSLKCEVRQEKVLGRLGNAASVGITYDYDPLSPQEAPKVTLQGKVCASSLRDLPSAVSKKVRQGILAAKGPLKKEATTVAHKAKGVKDTIADTAQRIKQRVKGIFKDSFHH
ncbi:hypothetical protein L7F22_016469 [Adiantum nelumboides]|nr:hypothetical protein [Adiantum nelumboides]